MTGGDEEKMDSVDKVGCRKIERQTKRTDNNKGGGGGGAKKPETTGQRLSPPSASEQERIEHTQQRCLRRASQFCGGVNSLLRKKKQGSAICRMEKNVVLC